MTLPSLSLSRRNFIRIATMAGAATLVTGCSSNADTSSSDSSSASNTGGGQTDYRGNKVDGNNSDVVVLEGPGWVFDSDSGQAYCAARLQNNSSNVGWGLSFNYIARDSSGAMVGSSGYSVDPDCIYPDHDCLVYFSVINLTESPATIELSPTVRAWYDNSEGFDPYLDVPNINYGYDDFGLYATLEVNNTTDKDFGAVTGLVAFYDADDNLLTGCDGYASGISAGATIALSTNHISFDDVEGVYDKIQSLRCCVVGGNYNG